MEWFCAGMMTGGADIFHREKVGSNIFGKFAGGKA
jgi:hypothetical protein